MHRRWIFLCLSNKWLNLAPPHVFFVPQPPLCGISRERGGKEGVVIAKFGGGKREGDFIGPSLFPPSSAPPPLPPPNDDDSIFPEKKGEKRFTLIRELKSAAMEKKR